MNTKIENSNSNKKYGLLLLSILLIVLGIWKCPNLIEKDPKVELTQKKGDSLKVAETVKPDVLSEVEKTSLDKNESSLPIKEEKSPILKPKEETIPSINTNKDKKESPGIEVAEEITIPKEVIPKKEIVKHWVNKSIDKRLPAT